VTATAPITRKADVVDLVEQIGFLEDDGAEGQSGKRQDCAGERGCSRD